MEITVSRIQGTLIFEINGKMDGFGSQKVSESLQTNLSDSDIDIIFDLKQMDYISSAGLRVFQEIYRRIKERNGKVIICQVQDFPLGVMKMGGFLQALQLYTTLEEAISSARNNLPLKKENITGQIFTFEEINPDTASLQVLGNLTSIKEGRITDTDIQKLSYIPGTFEIGIGAVGKNGEFVKNILGNMAVLKGDMLWTPADGNETADFFTRDIMEGGEIERFGIFQVTHLGPFQYLLTIQPEHTGAYTINALAEEISEFAKKKYPDFSGVWAMSMKATIEGICSSDIRSSLVTAAKTKQNHQAKGEEKGHSLYSIPMRESIIEKVSEDNHDNRYQGEVLIGFGYGVDLERAKEKISQEILESIAIMPSPMHQYNIFLNINGAVLHDIPWNPSRDLNLQISEGLKNGSLVTMHHILGISKIRNGSIAVSFISSISVK
jgi:anti-anti-sigma factor